MAKLMTSIAFLAAALLVGSSAAADPPRFGLPLICPSGERCPVQQYVDHDPGPGFRDWACGQASYDGHGGTDFRVEDLGSIQRGVPVVAAAPGIVVATRDGEADHDPFDYDREKAFQRGCGNYVAIGHGDEWFSIYCHLRRGSISVVKGQRLREGEEIGLIGMSGSTDFPHLQFGLQHAGREVDPFLPDGPDGSCSASLSGSLWRPELESRLSYRAPEVLNAGFATGPVTMRGIEYAEYDDQRFDATAPAIVFYVRAINLDAGDVQRISLSGPGGRQIAANERDPLESRKAQLFLFVGDRRSGSERWPPGQYSGRFEILRNGRMVTSVERSMVLR